MLKDNNIYIWNRESYENMYIDSTESAIDALESIAYLLERKDNLKWKWIIILLHQALYGFCIRNLQGSDYYNVLQNQLYKDDNNIYIKKDLNAKWKRSKIVNKRTKGGYNIAWFDIESQPPVSKESILNRNEKLINFWSAIARVQDREFWMSRFEDSKPIILNEDAWISIELLNEYRNRFIHFIPITLGVNIPNLKKICFSIIEPIRTLAFNTNQIIYFNDFDKERIKTILNKLEKIFKQ